MDNIIEVIMNLFGEYENVFLKQYAEEKNVDIDELVEEDIIPILEDDLLDKGFLNEEIKEILLHQMSANTFYKLGSYMVALFNQPETFEEWKVSIKEDIMVNLPNDEVIKLWEAYQSVDY